MEIGIVFVVCFVSALFFTLVWLLPPWILCLSQRVEKVRFGSPQLMTFQRPQKTLSLSRTRNHRPWVIFDSSFPY